MGYSLPDRLFSTICLEVSPIRFLYPVSGFSVSSSYHLDSLGFYHLTDFGNSWALTFLPVQTTGSHMHHLDFLADQPVYFSRIPSSTSGSLGFALLHPLQVIIAPRSVSGEYPSKSHCDSERPSGIPLWHTHYWSEGRSVSQF